MPGGPYSDRFSTYSYAALSPLSWVDPLGLTACGPVPPEMVGCKEPGSGCCTASCIAELRSMLCSWAAADPWLDLAGAGAGATGGAYVGVRFGPWGAACGALVGGAAEHYSQEWAEDLLVRIIFFGQFKNCMQQGCNNRCPSGKPCWIEDQFSLTAGEVFGR